MYRLAICSLFRDNVADVRRTFIERSRWQYDKDRILHICIEGDSKDGTYEALKAIDRKNVIVEKVDQGTVKIGSFAEPGRLKALAQLWNRAFEIALERKVQHVFLLDSDITVPPQVIPKLLESKKDVISPMFFFENSIFFRDTWAYHKDGVDFINRHPYHVSHCNNVLYEVDGVGCPLMHYKVLADGARCDENEVRGLSKSIKELGYKIFMDPRLAIYHPRDGQTVPENHER